MGFNIEHTSTTYFENLKYSLLNFGLVIKYKILDLS